MFISFSEKAFKLVFLKTRQTCVMHYSKYLLTTSLLIKLLHFIDVLNISVYVLGQSF
jgi:hypothetical protein